MILYNRDIICLFTNTKTYKAALVDTLSNHVSIAYAAIAIELIPGTDKALILKNRLEPDNMDREVSIYEAIKLLDKYKS